MAGKEVAKIVVGKVRVKLYFSPGNVPGQLCANYCLSSADGYSLGQGQFCVDYPAIREAVLKTIAARGPVGWSFKQLKRKANSIAHRVSVNKIARQVSAIASDPRFQKVATMAAVVYPPLGIPMGVVVKTAQLYKDAKAGDPAARAKVVSIVKAAEQGNGAAQKLAKSFAVFQAAENKGYDVGGWADKVKKGWLVNIPYRSNIAAGELDRHRPGHVLRGLYNVQLQAIARGDFPRGGKGKR